MTSDRSNVEHMAQAMRDCEHLLAPVIGFMRCDLRPDIRSDPDPALYLARLTEALDKLRGGLDAAQALGVDPVANAVRAHVSRASDEAPC